MVANPWNNCRQLEDVKDFKNQFPLHHHRLSLSFHIRPFISMSNIILILRIIIMRVSTGSHGTRINAIVFEFEDKLGIRDNPGRVLRKLSV